MSARENAARGAIEGRLSEGWAEMIATLAEAIEGRPKPLLVGISGAQGSGKSTAAAILAEKLSTGGCPSVVVALDDFYLPLSERRALAQEVHPLALTRGVPGTHDLALLQQTLLLLREHQPAQWPLFDKASDDRSERHHQHSTPADVVLLEGWCLGASPVAAEQLARPVNALECREDANHRWRFWVNDNVRSYRSLPIDLLIMLQAPSFAEVLGWRREQERRLAQTTSGPAIMDDAALRRFVMFYQRITEQLMRDLPGEAEIVIELGKERQVLNITER